MPAVKTCRLNDILTQSYRAGFLDFMELSAILLAVDSYFPTDDGITKYGTRAAEKLERLRKEYLES